MPRKVQREEHLKSIKASLSHCIPLWRRDGKALPRARPVGSQPSSATSAIARADWPVGRPEPSSPSSKARGLPAFKRYLGNCARGLTGRPARAELSLEQGPWAPSLQALPQQLRARIGRSAGQAPGQRAGALAGVASSSPGPSRGSSPGPRGCAQIRKVAPEAARPRASWTRNLHGHCTLKTGSRPAPRSSGRRREVPRQALEAARRFEKSLQRRPVLEPHGREICTAIA